MDDKKCDYFNQFIKLAINDLKKNGSCYVFHKYQVEEMKNINQKLIDSYNENYKLKMQIVRYEKLIDRL